jgi:hypothetical protein
MTLFSGRYVTDAALLGCRAMMTKAERDALTTLVRQRFKLLRHDIEVRKAEMIADLDRRLAEQFSSADKAWNDGLFVIEQARDECNRKVNDVLRQFCATIGHDYPRKHDLSMVGIQGFANPIPERRRAARVQALRDIDAVEAKARHELSVTENRLLTDLLTTGLQSVEAQQFIGRIPEISSLMIPTARLAELLGPDEDQQG